MREVVVECVRIFEFSKPYLESLALLTNYTFPMILMLQGTLTMHKNAEGPLNKVSSMAISFSVPTRIKQPRFILIMVALRLRKCLRVV
ncbi:hypothetical protein TNIN_45891 [Trichonephila inaurata madagascariensis]|uniref:Uncharacterized protein n=1 Tax=Trichonephila inaurata madagascariensis TaxID=2747483 RepID=A0A8X6WMU7_9ARAC|nr:hypothetical protein TNIN_45891 [Trichonephila inaurata madagascariensis]